MICCSPGRDGAGDTPDSAAAQPAEDTPAPDPDQAGGGESLATLVTVPGGRFAMGTAGPRHLPRGW